MTKEEFNQHYILSHSYVYYKGNKHWTITKDHEEGLLEVVEDDDGFCDVCRSKWVRYENCTL